MDDVLNAGGARKALLRAAEEELIEKGHASVSLRAVARRAGVSHAAPAHFFADRAGMLTAVATEGFQRLARALEDATERAATSGQSAMESLGGCYVDFGLDHPALMDLMFRRSELDPDDVTLIEAQRSAIGLLRAAVADVAGENAEEWSLVSWAVVHGLVALVREGALARVLEQNPDDASAQARRLVSVFAAGVAAAR